MKNTLVVLTGAAALAACFTMPSFAHDRAVGLYTFGGASGYAPSGGVVADRHGNVFGTTTIGGNGPCDGEAGCGTVYELSPPSGGSGAWTFNALYNFQGGQDGSAPYATLTLGPNGSIYGYTTGGTYGTVFQLLPPAGGSGAWTFQILYIFPALGGGNLEFVYSPLLRHGKALYGIASGGSSACGQTGCGSVFRLTPPKSGSGTWHKKTLYAFTGSASDGLPTSIAGFNGQDSLFVSTSLNHGAVVQLAPAGGAWNETVLTTFNGGSDGSAPASLVLTANGTLYGIAGANRGGLAFQLTNRGSGWTRTNIAAINHNGYGPNSLAAGASGTLIGTIGGDPDFFAGNVFQLTPPASGSTWTYGELWNFNHGPDRNPNNVVTGLDGHLFGVLNGGDPSGGSLFELK